MRKVVFLTTIPSPYRVAFFNEWGKFCDLTVIFEKKASSERSDLWKKVDVNTFKPIFLNGVSVKANKAFCPEIIQWIKKLEYDVFIIGGYNTPTAILASEWLKHHKIPYILNADGGYIKKDKLLIEWIKRRYISNADAWICTSDKTVEYFTYYGADSSYIFKYPFTSIREEKILRKPISKDEKRKICKWLGIKEDRVLLSVGQFIHRKGFDILLEAVNQLGPDVGIYLIGGKITAEYQAIIDKYNMKNVHFLDFMSPESLAEYYKAADMFVFPTREDIWGLVINEAAAYGLPIITTFDCIAGLEMVKNANGRLVNSDNVNELRLAIVELLSNSDLLSTMSEKSLHIANQFTIERMAIEHGKIVEEFIRIHGGSTR